MMMMKKKKLQRNKTPVFMIFHTVMDESTMI